MYAQPTNRQLKTTSAFTLVELLVVVSIIALLLGLLLPSLRDAREQAKQVACKKNFTNMWNGILAYSYEYNDRVPYMEHVSDQHDPFDPKNPTAVGVVLGPYVEYRSFQCPSAVAGYPETDPNRRNKWKLTYDFNTADQRTPGYGVPYDNSPDAYSGKESDPAVANEVYFDGRPLTRISINRPPKDIPGGDDEENPGGNKVEIIWSYGMPMIADALGERTPGDREAGRPIYPHRGTVRRQSDVFRTFVSTSDPRVISARRPGYFHLQATGEHKQIYLTRYSPDSEPLD
ncbi:MAG TPA: type II secretion system protein [Phycisphaerae bacterium]|nr:type II secretion system protein [Phycisphaerae bacterium]